MCPVITDRAGALVVGVLSRQSLGWKMGETLGVCVCLAVCLRDSGGLHVSLSGTDLTSQASYVCITHVNL